MKLNGHAFLHLITYVFIAALLVIGARSYNTLQTRQLTQCQFNHDLGDLAAVKVVVSPQTHKASKVGIAIVADSRAAFRGLGCRGHLATPVPSFSHWAKVYGLPSD